MAAVAIEMKVPRKFTRGIIYTVSAYSKMYFTEIE